MAGENVLPLQIRKRRQQILHGIATRQIFQNHFHGITQTLP
jgi:hypothetical protein